MKTIRKWIIYQYNSVYNWVIWTNAKNKADRMHKLTGKRYFVIPRKGGLMVVDNDFVKFYNKNIKQKKDHIDIKRLLEMCYYATPLQSINRNKTIR
jgi:hypothetical protein